MKQYYKIFMQLTKAFVGAKTPRRKAIKLGAIEINIENFYVRSNCDTQLANMKSRVLSPQNSFINILHKKIQENKKPIRHRCGLVKCGGGNRARSTAIATEGQSRAVWPKSQDARECAVRNAPSSSDNYTNKRKTLLFSRVSGCWWR